MALEKPKAGGYPGHWVGRFIWDDGEATPFNAFRMFRKTVTLAEAPAVAALHITAADRYKLFVNGVCLGQGPARSVGPQWMSYDTHDVAAHLHAGENTLAVLAYFHGNRSAWSANQRAGLFVQLEWEGRGGAIEIAGTDGTWRMCAVAGYQREVGLINGFIGDPNEVWDARSDAVDWMLPGFDDAGWALATLLEPAEYVSKYWRPIAKRSCWSFLEPRLTPRLREREVTAARVASVGEIRELPAQVFNTKQVPERLAVEPHLARAYAVIENADALLAGGNGGCRLASAPAPARDPEGRGARSPSLILDFGRPVLGHPVLEFEAPAGAVIDIACGHELRQGRIVALEHTSRIGDRCIARAGRQTWQPFFVRTVRYMQVVVRHAAEGVRLHDVRVKAMEYPCERRGAFACSDPVLTALWDAGVNTVFLHMEDTMTIDSVRERLAYLLCGEIEQMHLAAFAAFGDLAITDQGFRQTTRSQLADGLLPMFIGSSLASSLGCPDEARPGVSGANPMTIPNYSFFYALAVWRRHRLTARPGFLEEHYPALVRIAGWCERHADETGLLYGLPNWVWLDWMESDLRGAGFSINALYAQMLTDMGQIATALELPRDAARWEARAATVRGRLREGHWNAARGLFVDGVVDGVQSGVFTEIANGMALHFGIATPEQATAIVRQIVDPAAALTRVSPLYFHYVIEGLIQAGAVGEAYGYMARRYAPLFVDNDFPTLFEAWPEQGFSGASASGIHGGGAGVVWTLTQHVLGIRPLAPGFAAVEFDPQPGGLDWAKGVVPTPRGDIRVAWRRGADGRVTGKAVGPAGVRIETRVDAGGQ